MNDYPKIGLIGCGNWGRNLARNFHSLESLKVISARSPQGRRNAEESAPGVEVVGNPDEILDRADLAAVVLATPAETHYALTMRALEAGKDVFVEKPMALNAADGEDMVKKAESLGRILMVGHILEYHPAVTALKAVLKKGDLGQLLHLSATRLNCGKIRSEENVWWSFAPHDVSLILRLAGRLPEKISCCGNPGLTPGVSDAVTAFLWFSDGLTAGISVDWAFPFKERRLSVAGERGMAVFDDCAADHKLVRYHHRIHREGERPASEAGKSSPMPISDQEPLLAECRHFLECVASRRQPLSDGRSGLAVLRVLRAGQESMEQSGAPVFIGEG